MILKVVSYEETKDEIDGWIRSEWQKRGEGRHWNVLAQPTRSKKGGGS